MDIIIKESGAAKPLVYVDSATGTECTEEVLRAFGALNYGQFAYDEERQAYVAGIDDYNQWKDYLAVKQEEEKTMYGLCQEYGEAAVSEIFMKYQHNLNTLPEYEHEVMERIFAIIREELGGKK